MHYGIKLCFLKEEVENRQHASLRHVPIGGIDLRLDHQLREWMNTEPLSFHVSSYVINSHQRALTKEPRSDRPRGTQKLHFPRRRGAAEKLFLKLIRSSIF